MAKGDMTPKQKLFCDYYLANGYNALQAYEQAFGVKDNANKPSYPYTLLKNPKIKEYIQARRQEVYDSLNIDAMRIIQELADMAFAAKDDQVYVPTVKLKALEQLSKNLGLQTQKMETKDVIEVTLVEDDDDQSRGEE